MSLTDVASHVTTTTVTGTASLSPGKFPRAPLSQCLPPYTPQPLTNVALISVTAVVVFLKFCRNRLVGVFCLISFI